MRALERQGKELDYYATELSQQALNTYLRSLSRLGLKNVRCRGLLGTFDDAKIWLQSPAIRKRPKCLFSLGSAIGNMSNQEAVAFLADFAEVLREQRHHERHLMVVGLDSCKSEARVRSAYDDLAKVNAGFMLNSLSHANKVLGYPAFDPADWSVEGEWNGSAYRQALVPLKDVIFEGTLISPGEKVNLTQSQKYDAVERLALWRRAGWQEEDSWSSEDESFGAWFPDPLCSLQARQGGFLTARRQVSRHIAPYAQ